MQALPALLGLDTTPDDFARPFEADLSARRFAMVAEWLADADPGRDADDSALVSIRGWDAGRLSKMDRASPVSHRG